jgi:hypothetical protein
MARVAYKASPAPRSAAARGGLAGSGGHPGAPRARRWSRRRRPGPARRPGRFPRHGMPAGSTPAARRSPRRDPVSGKVQDQRVRHCGDWPSRGFACDRYPAARRSTSFSCSNSRILRLASFGWGAGKSTSSQRSPPGPTDQVSTEPSSVPQGVVMALLDPSGPRLAVASRSASARGVTIACPAGVGSHGPHQGSVRTTQLESR